jgi:hypothetical protein
MHDSHYRKIDGIYGTSDAPYHCPECGEEWHAGERVWTGDEAGIAGFEDWMYCKFCDMDLFYPVVNLPKDITTIKTQS